MREMIKMPQASYHLWAIGRSTASSRGKMYICELWLGDHYQISCSKVFFSFFFLSPFLPFVFLFFFLLPKKLLRAFFWQTYLRHFSLTEERKASRRGRGMRSSMSYNVVRWNGVYGSRQAERWQFWGKNAFCLSSHWCYQASFCPATYNE